MSQAKPPQRRLGRGLSSLLSSSELPVEAEVGSTVASPKIPINESDRGGTTKPMDQSAVSGRQSAGRSDAVLDPGNQFDASRTADETNSTMGSPSEIGSTTSLPTESHETNPNGLPLDQIVPNPHQPRRRFSDSSLQELASSVKAAGVIQPVIVRRVEQGFQLIAGERRWRAARLAGLTTIPAIIRDVDAYTQAQMALIENIQREDLNPIDRAESYKSLMNQLGLTQAELAGRLGEDRSSIAHFLRLLELSEPVRQLVRDGAISLGHAKLLATISDINEQQRLAAVVVKQDLSVRNLERIIQLGSASDNAQNEPKPASAHLMDLERNLSRQLGMRCQVKAVPKKGRGRLVIHYANLDQFDDLLKRLGVRNED